jgi:hypothetical protein
MHVKRALLIHALVHNDAMREAVLGQHVLYVLQIITELTLSARRAPACFCVCVRVCVCV